MNNPFVDALFHHAQSCPDAVIWADSRGRQVTYGQLARDILGHVKALGLPGVEAVSGERLVVEAENTPDRLAWAVAGMFLGLPTLALSPYQRSGRFEDMRALWNPSLWVQEQPAPTDSSLPARLRVSTLTPSDWSAVYDLNEGHNLPVLGQLPEASWLQHLDSLLRQAPMAAGEVVASALPDTLGGWLDVWALVATQGGALRQVELPSFLADSRAWDWPAEVKQAHMSSVQALLLRPDTIPADAVVWIHGSFPQWLPQRLPAARPFPRPTVERGLGWELEAGRDNVLYEFGIDSDPRADWRREKEAALVGVPGIVEAIVPVHPLGKEKPRPIGVLCIEETPEAIAACRQAVEALCASDTDLAGLSLVWMGNTYLRYHCITPEGLLGDSLSLIHYMAEALEDAEQEPVGSP